MKESTLENQQNNSYRARHAETLEYYDLNADNYAAETEKLDLHDTQDMFLNFLPKKSYILDFGCGSGRDTKYFLKNGYRVDAIDGCEEFVRYASRYTGIKVKHQYFQELNEEDKYNGIWACASVLHLDKKELKDVLERIWRALLPNGIVFLSFKYGEFEGIRDGRYYVDFTEASFEKYLKNNKGFAIEKYWIVEDWREVMWLNILLKKKPDL